MGQLISLQHGTLLAAALALLLAFSGGFRDSSTMVATLVSTRILSPVAAFSLCAVFEFLGALFLGHAVAKTIGHGLLAGHADVSHADMFVVLTSALLAALVWGVISWWRVWPTSTNHALFGGLLGSSWVVWGANHMQNKLIGRVFLILILTPIVGFLLSAAVTAFFRWAGEWFTRKIQRFADGLHVAATMIVALAHGSNDGQMIMGFLVGILGMAPSSPIPFRVRTVVATGLALGVLFGGRNLLKKLGMKFYRIRSLQGLGAEFTSAATVLVSVAAGFPASTTQVIAGSIVGAGVAKNAKAVRWHVAQDIILSWIITLPAAAALAMVICFTTRQFFKGAM